MSVHENSHRRAKAAKSKVRLSSPDERKEQPMVLKESVVEYCIRGSTGGKRGFSTSNLVERVQSGLSIEELDYLQASLDIPIESLAPKLGISRATLHRRKGAGRLHREESDRVLRFARLMGKAIEVFETKENARKWLGSPQTGLGGAVPLDYAETEVGAREVEDLLGRIEYGVYS
jgi:putative toxin-antitoxin system antitoxin component (TIGR02293 family)